MYPCSISYIHNHTASIDNNKNDEVVAESMQSISHYFSYLHSVHGVSLDVTASAKFTWGMGESLHTLQSLDKSIVPC